MLRIAQVFARSTIVGYVLSALCSITSTTANGQTAALPDLLGTWYFHQHYLDSTLIADADVPLPFPRRDFDMMTQAAAKQGMQAPDSATFAQQIFLINESYRQYRIVFDADSTYVTVLPERMVNWLPKNGRVGTADSSKDLQLLGGAGSLITSSVHIKNGEVVFIMNGLLASELSFRRSKP